MKVFCLGGAGKICRESIMDLVKYSSFEKITVADLDEDEGLKVVEWLDDNRVDFVKVDLKDKEDTIKKMSGYDIVMDGTTIALNDVSTYCIAQAGCHGINLNGFGEEYKYDEVFKRKGKIHVPGFGMTPGTTQMMAMYAANKLDIVEKVYVSHGSFRPIAFSKSITETTTYEYDPKLSSRVVFEDGEFKQVPPFARPREVELPEPYGKTIQYIIPHSETKTLAKALKNKGVRLIEVRGTWPEKNMLLVRGLYEYGILRNETINIKGQSIGIMDCISEYLQMSKEGKDSDIYGYSLHIEVVGKKDDKRLQYIITHTHPTSDGSIKEWEKLRAYTRNVGIPMAIATELIARGDLNKSGVLNPEEVFNPEEIFKQLEKREIFIQERVCEIK